MPSGARPTALLPAAFGALLLAATVEPVAAMPLREGGALTISCHITGLPPRETAAAESRLCARVVASASRGAPFAVAAGRPDDGPALHLRLSAHVSGAAAQERLLAMTAQLTRPGQSATAPPLTSVRPPVRYVDAAAVGEAIDAALADVLPWRHARRAPVPTPPRAH